MKQSPVSTNSEPKNLAAMVGGRTSYSLVDALDCFREVGTLALRKAFSAIAEHGGAAWQAVSSRRALSHSARDAFRKSALTFARAHPQHPHPIR